MPTVVVIGDPEYGELLSYSGGAVVFTYRDGKVWRWYGDRFIEVEKQPDILSMPPRRKAEGWFGWYGPEVKESNGA